MCRTRIRTARQAAEAFVRPGGGDVHPCVFEVFAATRRTCRYSLVAEHVDVRMRRHPTNQTIVNLLGKAHVLDVVALHQPPGFVVTIHATLPEVHPGVRHLRPDAEFPRHMIEFVGREPEPCLLYTSDAADD